MIDHCVNGSLADLGFNSTTSTSFSDLWQTLPDDRTAARRNAAGLIERSVFDTADYPEAERADAYQHLLAASARVTPLDSPFRARAVVYVLGDLRISLFDGVAHRFERSPAKVAFDQLDQVTLQHMASGRATGTFDGVAVAVPEGSVYGTDYTKPVTVEEHGPVRSILVGLKRPVALGAFPAIDRLHGLLLDHRCATPYLRTLYDLVPKLDALPSAEAPQRAAELLAALARCVGEAVEQPDRWSNKRRDVIAFIDLHLADRRLTPDFIAGSLRMSRSTLFSAFRDTGGVERAIVDRRLDRARMMLVQSGPRPSVARLAHLCGFSSPEHLARVFRQRFGSAPSRFVTDASAAPSGHGLGPDGSDDDGQTGFSA